MFRLMQRGLFGLALFLAASIPVVDQLDVLFDFWWMDWLDGLWTVVASAALAWCVRIALKMEPKTHG